MRRALRRGRDAPCSSPTSFFVSEQRRVDGVAEAMDREEVDLLDAGGPIVWNAQMDVARCEKFTHATAALAGQRDDAHLALLRRLHGSDDVRGVPGRRDREEHVALAAERAHLLREDLLERVV